MLYKILFFIIFLNCLFNLQVNGQERFLSLDSRTPLSSTETPTYSSTSTENISPIYIPELDSDALRIKVFYDDNNIYVRWASSKTNIWKKGNEVGYKLSIISLDPNNHYGNTWSTYILPITETAWDDVIYNNNDFAQVAKGLIYSPNNIEAPILNANSTLGDYVQMEKYEQTKLFFASYIADQDFQVAKGMGLGFHANYQAPIASKILYTIQLNTNDPAYENTHAYAIIDMNQPINLPQPQNLKGVGGDKTASIKWNTQECGEFYTAYDIERSTDGQNFTKLNNLPFVFFSDDPNTETALYQDTTLIDNNTTYYYKIRGISPFGVQTPASDVVEIQGVEPRLDLTMSIDSIYEGYGQITLYYKIDPALQNKIGNVGFYRADKVDGEYTFIGLSSSNSTERIDPNPLTTAYYKIIATDYNGRKYVSNPKLAQIKDNTPPSIPIALTGQFITKNKIELQWNPNQEPDLKGYRVFVGNHRNGTFTQITKKPIKTEAFYYTMSPKLHIDSLYFKIFALDYRENTSDFSQVFAIKTPDRLRPSSPILFKTIPTPQGVQIGWTLSESEDVTKHILERKPTNAPEWIEVVQVNVNDESSFEQNLAPNEVVSTNFIDTTVLERREYQYRLLAYDSSGNVGSSDIVKIRPFDSGKRGDILNFNTDIQCVPKEIIANQPAFDILERILETYEDLETISFDSLALLIPWSIITSNEYNSLIGQDPYDIYVFLSNKKMQVWGNNLVARVELTWGYTEEAFLQDFQIYRSLNGSNMMLYKTVSIEQLPFYRYLDEEVESGQQCFYKIIARHKDGGLSSFSKTLIVRVP